MEVSFNFVENSKHTICFEMSSEQVKSHNISKCFLLGVNNAKDLTDRFGISHRVRWDRK